MIRKCRQAIFSILLPFRISFQWHHDSFDIPEGGVLLATSPVCPHQAFRIGTCAWGLPFHPEVAEPIIRDWCVWDSSTVERTEELVAAFSENEENYRATARRLSQNFFLSAWVMR